MMFMGSQPMMQGGGPQNQGGQSLSCNMCSKGGGAGMCSNMFEPAPSLLSNNEINFIARAKAEALSQMGGGHLAQMFQGMDASPSNSGSGPSNFMGLVQMGNSPIPRGSQQQQQQQQQGGGGMGCGMGNMFSSLPIPEHPSAFPVFDCMIPQNQGGQNQGGGHSPFMGSGQNSMPGNNFMMSCGGPNGGNGHQGFSAMRQWSMSPQINDSRMQYSKNLL